MQIKNTWESLVWIVIGISLLGIVLLGIWQLLSYSRIIMEDNTEISHIQTLSQNTQNIINNIDINTIAEWDYFYIHKNNTTQFFDIFTGAINKGYQYIDTQWEYIPDITAHSWTQIYSRKTLISKKDNYLNSPVIFTDIQIEKLIKK